MKLTALRLHNVRRFAGRGVAVENIGDGVNVLCAANEHGKSTCFDALYALFFQPHSGTPGPVQSLRPYSGGNPLIEADILTAKGSFRLAKQYYGARRAAVTDLASGRLVAQADEAENFIADLVRGGTGGPAGLLWVRQGRTGFEKQAKSEEEGEKRARADVLSSVKGEVEALTGGQRMSEVLAACEQELFKLVTPTLRPKASGRYAAAVEERDGLISKERCLADDVKALREALEGRRRLRARLSELEKPEDVAARRAAVATAEAAHAAATLRGEALDTAMERSVLRRNSRDEIAKRLEVHRGERARAKVLGIARVESAARRDAALNHQRDAIAASEAAARDVEAAECEEGAARDLLARLQQALRAREAAERLTQLRDRVRQADAERSEVEQREASLRALAVPEDVVRQLQDIEIEIAGLRAAGSARSPYVRIDYQEGAGGTVTIEGAPLIGGEERHLTSVATLDIAGIGALRVRSELGTPGSGLASATDKRRDLLERLGLDSLAAARDRLSAAKSGEADLELARRRLTLLAPKGMAVLREELARAEAESVGDVELDGDPDAARDRLAAIIQRVAHARNALRETRPVRDEADKAVVAAETALAGIDGELGALRSTLGPEDGRAERESAFARDLTKAEAALTEAEGQLEAARAAAPDIIEAEAVLSRRRSVLVAADRQIAHLREQQADLNGQIRTQSDGAIEEAWQEAIDLKAAAESSVARFEREVAVLTRLRAALEVARIAARDHYFEPVMTELRPLMGLLFEDASVVFDDRTLLPKSIRRNGQDEQVDVLSGGMREQLAVLTRLAFGRLLARDGRPAPIILDDALVYSDDDRIERVFDALHRQSREQQIIVFSCRQRAFAQLGGNVLRMTDWEPDRV